MIQNAILTSLQSRFQMTITSRAGLEKTLWRWGGGGGGGGGGRCGNRQIK